MSLSVCPSPAAAAFGGDAAAALRPADTLSRVLPSPEFLVFNLEPTSQQMGLGKAL